MREKEELDRKFDQFICAMKTRGFNPSLSHISVKNRPVMGQSDGTHRMGYLLSEQPNVFVPTQILSPIAWLTWPRDGSSWMSQLGMSSEEIEKLKECYHLLCSRMRRYIIAVIDKPVFDKNGAAFMHEINCIGIKYTSKKSDDLKMPRQYRRFFKNKAEIIILEIEIEHQILYYRHRRLQSKLADDLIDRWCKMVASGVYVAGTITESVALEIYLEENYSIETYMIKGNGEICND